MTTRNNFVSIIIPTKNEEANIENLLRLLGQASSMHEPTYKYEAIVVDDSRDKTKELAKLNGAKVIQGKGLGLGQAILDGIIASSGNIIVVMDADLSHNPHAIPGMLRPILNDGYDMVIGSRYINGGGSIGWEWHRRLISRVACLLALPVTSIKDATSGFFAINKDLIRGVKLEASSWKIMLEILLKTKPTRVIEVPIQFQVRKEGKSKFNRKQMIAYLKHIALLSFWKYNKFLKFCIVGGIGAIITFGLTWLLTEGFNLWYMFSLVIAVGIATISNYTLNTLWTFKIEMNPSEPDYEWKAFYKGSIIQKWWKQSIAKIVWEFVPNASKTLDIGCGSSPILTKYPKAIAIDTNEMKLNFMRQKFPNATYYNMSAEKTPFVENQFDHVICIEVIEHLRNPERAIEEMARVVRKNGEVVIATPDTSKLLWNLAERFTPYKEEHIQKFTKNILEIMCERNGLEPVEYKYVAGCDLVEMFRKI